MIKIILIGLYIVFVACVVIDQYNFLKHRKRRMANEKLEVEKFIKEMEEDKNPCPPLEYRRV